MTQMFGTSIRALAPLRHTGFRQVWVANLISDTAIWMQGIAAAWLLTSLSSSPLLVSLLQTAASFPAFLIGLPAGALADIFDRLRLLVWAHGWFTLTVAGLGLLSALQIVSPEILLLFTFLLGLSTALSGSVWEALIPEVIPREELSEALALYGSGIDLARAIGPVVAGVLVATLGAGSVFALEVVMGVYLIFALRRVSRQTPPSEVMPERVFGALRAGARYVRHARPLQVVLLRTGVFMVCGSALWALLPVLARYDLDISAGEYGVLFGAMGAGSMLATLVLPPLNQKLSRDRLVALATLLFASILYALSVLSNYIILCLLMGVLGIAWTVLMASFSVAVQVVVPDWVRARSLSFFQLIMQGGMAGGALLWGAIATRLGTPQTLSLAALCLGLSLLVAIPFRFGAGESLSFDRAHQPFKPAMRLNPQPDDGPVLVMLEYDIATDNTEEFVRMMQPLRQSRERDGATRWDLWQDIAVPGRFTECFIVESWAEHYRQYLRFTISDRELEDRVRALLCNGDAPISRFFIFAKPGRIVPILPQSADVMR